MARFKSMAGGLLAAFLAGPFALAQTLPATEDGRGEKQAKPKAENADVTPEDPENSIASTTLELSMPSTGRTPTSPQEQPIDGMTNDAFTAPALVKMGTAVGDKQKTETAWAAWETKEHRDMDMLEKQFQESIFRNRYRSPAGALSGISAERRISASIGVQEKPNAKLTVAPFPLAGLNNRWTDGIRLGLGANADGVIEIEGAWSVAIEKEVSLNDIGISSTNLDDAYKKMLPYKQDFVSLCGILGALGPNPNIDPDADEKKKKSDADVKRMLVDAQVACGLVENQPVADRPYGFTGAVNIIRKAIESAAQEGLVLSDDSARAKKLAEYVHPTPFDGLEAKIKVLPDLLTGERARLGRITLMPKGGVEFFPIRWGFNPDLGIDENGESKTKKLTKGQWRSWGVGFALSGERGRWAGGIGAGYKESWTEPDEEALSLLNLELQVSVVVAVLDGGGFFVCADKKRVNAFEEKCLKRSSRPRSVNGKLPPRLVIGVKGSVSFDPSYNAEKTGEVRATGVHDADVGPYVAVHVSDNLAFQIGVPIRATLVEQAAVENQNIAPLKDLQWSVPIYGLAILSH